MNWYAETLETKYAMQIILYIRENPGMSKTDVIRFTDGGNERTRFTRVAALINEGIIEVRPGSGKWNSTELYLTPEGQKIGKLIAEMNEIMCSLKGRGDSDDAHDEP